MEQIKLKALCVKSIDYRDNDNLITLIALGKGKISAVVKGSKKPQSKLRFSASPFCFGEYILTVGKTGKYTVTGCDLIDSFYKIREDIEKYYCASVILEILNKFIRELPNDKLLLSALRSLKNICYDEKNMTVALCEFMYEAIVLSGYNLPKIECKVCSSKENLFFDTFCLDFVCKLHKMNKGIVLSASEVEGLTDIYNGDFSKLNNYPNNIILNILYILSTFFSLISEEKFRTINSYFDLLKGKI